MSLNRIIPIGITLMCLFTRPVSAETPGELAARIDGFLERRFEAEQITPAPPAEDAEFLRRIHLDLLGSPPAPETVREFLNDQNPQKRSLLIDKLLADPQHAEHFATTWRELLLPEAESDVQLRYFQPGLEAWLKAKRTENVGFDDLVRELLSVPIAGPGQTPQLVLKDLKAPNPIAYLASKGGDPANLAAGTTRLFLGIRLECAQCHDHPFDAWSQTQFWNQAAFFAGIERKGQSPFSPLIETATRREIATMNDGKLVPAKFLETEPKDLPVEVSPRLALAEWMTAPENTQFAKATVNRVWGQLMGEGLVDPIDDFSQGNPPSHPELLEELAKSFAASEFDLTFLYQALCQTKAYQRTSRVTDASQDQPQLFAKMAIKPMSGEQFFATLSQAIGYQPQAKYQGTGRGDDPLRRRVLNQFPSSGLYSNPETSVSEVLNLMNGQLTVSAVSQESGTLIQTLMKERNLSPEDQIDQLCLLALGRLATAEERQELATYLKEGEANTLGKRLGDVLWVLLNTAEFRWNH